MLYDFALLNSENIDDGIAVLAKEARVVAVKKNVVCLCKYTSNFAACVRIICGDPLDVVSKTVEAVGCKRRMLRVGLSAVELDRCIDIALEERLKKSSATKDPASTAPTASKPPSSKDTARNRR